MSLKKKIENFAYDVSGLGAYVDEQSEELLVKQVTSAQTLQLINIQEGVKSSAELKLMDDTITYQTGDCDMTASGDTVFTDRALTVVPMGFKKGFCNKDLDGFWTQLQLRAGAMDEDKELIFEEEIVNYLLAKHSRALDVAIWQSDSALSSGNNSFFDGFCKILTVSNGCVDLNSSSTAAITTSNAYDTFYEMFENTPTAVAESDDYACLTGRENFNKLMKNLVDLNFFHYSPAQIATMDRVILPGTDMTVYKVNGLNGKDDAFVGRLSEFTFGTDLTGDFDTLEIWYSQDDDKIYIRSKFRAGVQVPFLDQIGVWQGTSSPS